MMDGIQPFSANSNPINRPIHLGYKGVRYRNTRNDQELIAVHEGPIDVKKVKLSASHQLRTQLSPPLGLTELKISNTTKC